MKVIENYKKALENSDEKLFRGFCFSSPRRDTGWSNLRSADERGGKVLLDFNDPN